VNRKPILFIPACEPGRGGGHITRCMSLTSELRARNRDSFVLLADNDKTRRLIESAQFNNSWVIRNHADAVKTKWEWVIFDRFQTPADELYRWRNVSAIIGIDEGGPCRSRFDFLIDVLPGVRRKRLRSGPYAPNILNPALLPLPERKRAPTVGAALPLKVLVSFGHEDTAGLGPAAAHALAEKDKCGLLDITLLSGTCSGMENVPAVRGIKSIPNLAEHLGDYDLLVTHYGITAFESLYACTPLVLVSPGAYHEKLARAAGFFSAGIGKRKTTKLAGLLIANNGINDSFLQKLKHNCITLAARHHLAEKPKQSLADLIDGCSPSVSRECRLCGAPLRRIVGRFQDHSYCRCPVCGIISMNRLTPPPVEYDREYFFESYKKQYGRTYIEDFPNLVTSAQSRLARISTLRARTNFTPQTKPRVLDIGCAYGPFLAAAQEAGFSPFGIDPAEDAVRYTRDVLMLPAICGVFKDGCLQEFNLPEGGTAAFDVVSLWYVIEHFTDCAGALAEIKKILRPGGILALVTPSFSGVSGRSSRARFLEHSPADHWTIWSPRSGKKALEKAGFTVKKIVCTGHHPERFPVIGRFAGSQKSPLYRILAAISRLFRLGDTFEVYAVNAREGCSVGGR
jgi:2-polyprenyl-3-methyl-5-hydroxy-6-metoxy-1,4-benzoquinol methylase/spore coat polysaccharide biosynthesis predicted glycosyltransferase SpsG